MGSALGRVDVVDEGEDRFRVAGVVLEGQLDDDVLFLALEENRPGVEDGLVLVEELDELDDPALVLELVRLVRPLISDAIRIPRLRKLSSRSRWVKTSKLNSVSSKISSSGQKVTLVPAFLVFPTCFSRPRGIPLS
jgi:hypothetical protein